ncbi:glycosyl transferase family 1 [Aeromonas veronii]|nr:glycosyl transferase family 1 [Aeromonas veronii]
MKILLVGEYSGVHTNLADALRSQGHIVLTLSDGDSYKNFPRDITIKRKHFSGKIGLLYELILEYLGVKGLICYLLNFKKINSLKGYDVVQIINPVAIEAFGSIANIFFIKKLSKNNRSLFLCALGDDTRWVDACLTGGFKYSPFNWLTLKTAVKYSYSLRYKYGFFFKTLQKTAERFSEKIIPGLLDYQKAYENSEKCTDIIRIPLSESLITQAKEKLIQLESFQDSDCRVIRIFHGWQLGRELKKGNYIFDDAVKKLISYKKENIDYQVVTSVPYHDYISKLNCSDIFLDQTNSYDRGVNALIGMAYGCVVFSGFEDSNIHPDIGVNAVPNSDAICDSLEEIINNPKLMYDMKINALKFIIENHEPALIASKYLEIWSIR